jgi:hypothetical protein
VNPDNNLDSVDQNGSISGQLEILDSVNEFSQEIRSMCSSSDDNVVDDSTSENENGFKAGVSEVSPVIFRQKLATWAAKKTTAIEVRSMNCWESYVKEDTAFQKTVEHFYQHLELYQLCQSVVGSTYTLELSMVFTKFYRKIPHLWKRTQESN